MKNNDILKKAFAQAAENELEGLPKEDKVIRPYSDEFRLKMQKLFESAENKACQGVPVKRKKIRAAVFLAAVLAAVMLSAVAVSGEGFIMNLFELISKPGKIAYYAVQFGENEKFEGEAENISDIVDKDKTSEIQDIVYSGEKVTLRFASDEGENFNWPDYGIMIYVDGVRQNFDAVFDGESFSDIEMLHLDAVSGKVRYADITFVPNIGKKGDVLNINVVKQYDPTFSYYQQCATEHKRIFVGHLDNNNDKICDKCALNLDEQRHGPSTYTTEGISASRLMREKDAPTQTAVIGDFDAVKISKLDEAIHDSYDSEGESGKKINGYDKGFSGLACGIYKDIDGYTYSEDGVVYTRNTIETEAKSDDGFILNLHGEKGEYRVAIYSGTQILPAFDGNYYADVKVKNGKQTEVTFSVDTTALPKGDSHFYAVYYKLDVASGQYSEVLRGDVFYVEVL